MSKEDIEKALLAFISSKFYLIKENGDKDYLKSIIRNPEDITALVPICTVTNTSLGVDLSRVFSYCPDNDINLTEMTYSKYPPYTPLKLGYQIDFWCLFQTDTNLIIECWSSNAFRFNLEVTIDDLKYIFVFNRVSANNNITSKVFGEKRIFHVLFDYEVSISVASISPISEGKLVQKVISDVKAVDLVTPNTSPLNEGLNNVVITKV